VLGLTHVQVVRGRAEEHEGHLVADVVTSRAVAPLDKLAGLSLALARPGGKVLAIKGSSAEAELMKARPVLARIGISDARVVQLGSGADGATATVVTFTAPEHRSSAGGAGRSSARVEMRPPGRPSGRAAGPTGRRTSRPNSRRGGG